MIKTTMKTALLQTLTPQKILWKPKKWTEWAMKLKKGKLKELTLKLKEWTQTIKEWKTNSYLLR